jgi:hypothetical protein
MCDIQRFKTRNSSEETLNRSPTAVAVVQRIESVPGRRVRGIFPRSFLLAEKLVFLDT